MLIKKISGMLLCISFIALLAACGSNASQTFNTGGTSYSLAQNNSQPSSTPTPEPTISIPSQKAIPTPNPTPTATASPAAGCITYSNETTLVPAKSGTLAAPYGPAPTSTEAQQLTEQLFQLINHDRAACDLPAFTWNDTLASGALLHSWNMNHCGFSHTCPDGSQPCQRIANEGFAGLSDCGENIGEAGPYPTPWDGLSTIQESMAHEAPGGWHRIHLFSTTLHQIGIGIYVDSNGWMWFTEDLVS